MDHLLALLFSIVFAHTATVRMPDVDLTATRANVPLFYAVPSRHSAPAPVVVNHGSRYAVGSGSARARF